MRAARAVIQFSPSQWQRIGHASLQARFTALARHVHPRAPRAEVRSLGAHLAAQAARAAAHGLPDEAAAARFALAAWWLGPDFDRRIPVVAQVLASPLSADIRSRFLVQFAAAAWHALAKAELAS